ncbi:hypothetical protein [Luteolibacter soli]|uniref:Uncharacterized protein n=1 Tax=Luteolibacter soli TaxID=3135280 RepID=A0ABU9AZJ0_9BACT
MIWKLILVLSLVSLVGAWLGRHWFWTKARMEGIRHDCGISVRELRQHLGLPVARGGTETHAAALGNAVRECGLLLLEKEGNTLAKSRIKGAYLTKALPALLCIFAFFACFRMRPLLAFAAALGVLAMWTLFRATGMTIEWRAVARGTEALKASRALKRVSDEEEVIRCAKASVWSTIWPF